MVVVGLLRGKGCVDALVSSNGCLLILPVQDFLDEPLVLTGMYVRLSVLFFEPVFAINSPSGTSTRCL